MSVPGNWVETVLNSTIEGTWWNVIYWGRDSPVPAERNHGSEICWSSLKGPVSMWAGAAGLMLLNRICKWYLMQALKRFSAKINCPRDCLPSPPWANSRAGSREEAAGMGLWRWSLVEPPGPGSCPQLWERGCMARCPRGERRSSPWKDVKDNSKGLLKVLVLSSEVVKCQIKLRGDKSRLTHLKGAS